MDDLEVIANLEYGKAIEKIALEAQEKVRETLAKLPPAGCPIQSGCVRLSGVAMLPAIP
jgi:uncharacterized alkaline shock family protein YloU